MSQDAGLIKRGLFLLALLSALATVLLVILFQRPASTLPAPTPRPELLAASLVRSGTAFPDAIAWPQIYQIGEAFPSPAGWNVRYNAAGALARRGSSQVPWEILLEMLDEDRQMHNFRVQLQDGKRVPDEGAARLTMVYALQAIAEWHKKQSGPNPVSPALARVYAAVDQLAANPVMEIKTQVANTRQVFFR
jgi:hypothetical protein